MCLPTDRRRRRVERIGDAAIGRVPRRRIHLRRGDLRAVPADVDRREDALGAGAVDIPVLGGEPGGGATARRGELEERTDGAAGRRPRERDGRTERREPDEDQGSDPPPAQRPRRWGASRHGGYRAGPVRAVNRPNRPTRRASAMAGAVVDHDPPEGRLALRPRMEPVRRRDLVDPRGRVGVGAIGPPPQPHPEVLEADRDPDHESVARQDEPVGGPGAGGRQADEPFGVGVAADDPVERHDVRGLDGGGALDEVTLDELDPVEQVEPPSLVTRDLQRRRRPIHEHRVAGAGPEQLLVDDADPAADVEDGRAASSGTAPGARAASASSCPARSCDTGRGRPRRSADRRST